VRAAATECIAVVDSRLRIAGGLALWIPG